MEFNYKIIVIKKFLWWPVNTMLTIIYARTDFLITGISLLRVLLRIIDDEPKVFLKVIYYKCEQRIL